MNLFSFLYRESRKLLAISILTTIISGLSGAALVGVIQRGIADIALAGHLAPLFFGLCVAYLAFKSCAEISLLNLTQRAIYRLRIDLSHRILATAPKQLRAIGKHGLLLILSRDIDTFIQACQMMPLALGNAIIVVACMGYMAWTAGTAFVVCAICLVVGTVAYHRAERPILRHLADIRERIEGLHRHFHDLVEGSRELQLNAARGAQFVEQVIAPGALDARRAFVRSMTGYTVLGNVGAVLFYVVLGVVLFVLPRFLPQQVQAVVAVTLILLFLIRPISELMFTLPAIRQAAIVFGKIQELEHALDPAGEGTPAAAPFPARATTRLELRGVCHRYPGATDDSQFMLGPLDFTFRDGEITYVVGGNGSGKTTLAMLLLGLYEPEAGMVVLNGEPVTRANVKAYRQHFSAVLADFHLFEQLLGTDSEELGALASHYIGRLGMAHKVRLERGRFSSIDLSTGQRKRLALVSAYLEDRPFYLFDEWAADQDPAFKQVFYTELLPELKARGKCVIVITHDDAYFSHADRVVKLADGQFQSIVTNTTSHAPPLMSA